MGRRNTLGLSLLAVLYLLAPSAHAGGHGLGESFEEMIHLPGGTFSAATISGRSGIYFLSANGRYAIRGEITDLWSGRELGSMAEIRTSVSTLDLSALETFWDDLAPVELGQGERIVTLFVDPVCPACAHLMARLSPHFSTHRFRVVPVPALGKQSGQLVRQVHCARDRDAARAAVADHRYRAALDQDPGCDLRPLQRRVVVSQLFGITEVPFAISADGTLHKGAGPSFETWLGGLAQ